MNFLKSYPAGGRLTRRPSVHCGLSPATSCRAPQPGRILTFPGIGIEKVNVKLYRLFDCIYFYLFEATFPFVTDELLYKVHSIMCSISGTASKVLQIRGRLEIQSDLVVTEIAEDFAQFYTTDV